METIIVIAWEEDLHPQCNEDDHPPNENTVAPLPEIGYPPGAAYGYMKG